MENQEYQNMSQNNNTHIEEKASVGLAILSFIIPLVGLILFITKRKERPKTAKACGITALVSVIISIVLSVIMSVAGTSLLGAALDENSDSSYSEMFDLENDSELSELFEDSEN